MISNHLTILSKNLEHYLPLYDNIILLGDFNSECTDLHMSEFCGTFNLASLIKDKTCFKSLDNPSCIDLILTNKPRSFQNSGVIETGLSDFHKLTITVLKTSFRKKPPKIISYRCYKKFSKVNFRHDLEFYISGINIYNTSNDDFVDAFMHILEAHAPTKQKYIRANDSPFITKELRKEHMLRSKLRNKYYKEKSNVSLLAYKKQRNKCVSLLRKVKKSFYRNLNPSIICDNKKFWKTVKPLFSAKVTTSQNITLIENNVIVDDDKHVSEIFNDFFSNVVTNLNIENITGPSNNNIIENDPVHKAISKYEKHPSVLKIKEYNSGTEHFSFLPTNLDSVTKEILALNRSKATPKDSIPTKIIMIIIEINRIRSRIIYFYRFTV